MKKFTFFFLLLILNSSFSFGQWDSIENGVRGRASFFGEGVFTPILFTIQNLKQLAQLWR